jgi:hypothetical protein
MTAISTELKQNVRDYMQKWPGVQPGTVSNKFKLDIPETFELLAEIEKEQASAPGIEQKPSAPATTREPEYADPLAKLPTAFKTYRNWVTWQDVEHKAPIISGSFNNASSDDPSTWMSYSTALENIKNGKGYGNLGFVTNGEQTDYLTALDIDGCRNPATGELTEWAQRILKMLPATYAEITPSKSGIRAWVKMLLPEKAESVFKLAPTAGHGSKVQIEVYDDRKYFTMTGEQLDNTADRVASLTDETQVNSLFELLRDLKNQFPIAGQTETKSKRARLVAQHDGTLRFEPIPPDPAFKELQDKVGWTPLENRLHKMEDPRFHNVELKPGKLSFCPMPQHAPRGKDVHYGSACFGVVQGHSHLVHCFGCGYTGDLVKTVKEFDQGAEGGKIERATMYDVARAICQEEQLNFNDFFPESKTEVVPAPVIVADSTVGEDEAEPIPPFDPSVVNGIYKKFVDVATRGTTLAPQFVYAIAKTVVGARMAGKVKFENLDVEPRFYTALIGETGSGKGESWRRVFQILNVEHQIGNVSGLKIINSADSGAGIRDTFFEPPDDLPILCYIDEVESFGNKASATRNPAILDTLIELADSTSISRVVAKPRMGKSRAPAKTKDDARFCTVMCGQDGHVYMKAFAGRTKLGLWDRLYPEYSIPVEAGDLPPISVSDAFELLAALKSLDYSGTMTMSVPTKARLDKFWAEQEPEVRKKARWKKNLTLDVYMSAFGRGSKVAELEDAEIAIKIFVRQLAIRKFHFTTEVPDRTGYYLGLIKSITAKMERQVKAGIPPASVAKSRRDYERETHAHRDNETHIFQQAWRVYEPTWLTKITVQKTNGQTYEKYLPADDE